MQCLRNFTSPEKLAPDAYSCRSKECANTPQRARKHLTIKKLPPTLCIQLKVRNCLFYAQSFAVANVYRCSVTSTTRATRKSLTRN